MQLEMARTTPPSSFLLLLLLLLSVLLLACCPAVAVAVAVAEDSAKTGQKQKIVMSESQSFDSSGNAVKSGMPEFRLRSDPNAAIPEAMVRAREQQ